MGRPRYSPQALHSIRRGYLPSLSRSTASPRLHDAPDPREGRRYAPAFTWPTNLRHASQARQAEALTAQGALVRGTVVLSSPALRACRSDLDNDRWETVLDAQIWLMCAGTPHVRLVCVPHGFGDLKLFELETMCPL